MTRRALLLVALAAACDDGAPCPAPVVSLRDPEGLTCAVRRVPTEECPDIGVPPPWPSCGHPCESIRDASTCASVPGCRVAWLDCIASPESCDEPQGFIACYGIVTATPPPGACVDLPDAEACASRDDCAGVYLKGTTCPPGDPFEPQGRRQPDGEACRFTYIDCTDELSPPT